MTEPAPKLELKDVYKSFGRNHVLRGVNLSIPKGRSLVVIGGSGTGKSVTIKCVLGLLHPDKGSIKVDGFETAGATGKDRDDLMKKFGMLFQGGALFDSLPIWENVGFGLMQGKGVGKDEARTVAIDKLRAVGLPARVADMLPAELSGGMQKRVGLARAIAANPEIIFFDEPTTGLDPIMADVINDLIVETSKGLGATTLSITHDMASARKIADDIAMIYKGQIIWQGAANDIDHSGNEYVDQFIKGSAQGPIKMEV
ncbi:MAG TPA: ATP-binding cassette domain-containing protein [Patescibacteria group bacterium]|nr:ATP-binding cassette domain-containing protein [Patescibacteria group bacterium]